MKIIKNRKMVTKLYDVKDDCESCNFCDKGELNFYKNRLIYPYKKVVMFNKEKSGLTAVICEECLEELYANSKKLFTSPPQSTHL